MLMGIVVSKEPLDYNAIDASVNKSSQQTFAAKLNDHQQRIIKNVNFSNTNNGGIYFKADATDKNKRVGCVVEIDKQ